MPKLYVMCGISGSGKSAYAKSIQSSARNRIIIISTDELRAMLYGNASDQTDPELIFNMAYSMIQMLLERDYDVIFDAMNLKARARKDLINRFRGIATMECVVCNVSAEEACHRQTLRERHVPEDIVFAQSKRMSIPTYDEGWDIITYNEDNDNV